MKNVQVKLIWKYGNENQWRECKKSKASWDFGIYGGLTVSSAYMVYTFFHCEIAVFLMHRAVIKKSNNKIHTTKYKD